MPNYCNYEMKINGTKRAIRRVINCLKQRYDYGEAKPSGKHFFRVFDTYPDEEEDWYDNKDGTYTAFIWGDCAWSVHSAMCGNAKDIISYYASVKKDYPEWFMGTNLKEQSKNCLIEVFSEEGGCMFSEHYLYHNGKCIIDDCKKLTLVDENGNPVDDDYEGECNYKNPNRRCFYEEYRWCI